MRGCLFAFRQATPGGGKARTEHDSQATHVIGLPPIAPGFGLLVVGESGIPIVGIGFPIVEIGLVAAIIIGHSLA